MLLTKIAKVELYTSFISIYFLATCFSEAENIQAEHETDRVIRKLLEKDKNQWHHRLPWFKLFSNILEKGGHDSEMLAKIKKIIEENR